jgi:hypothetical protein
MYTSLYKEFDYAHLQLIFIFVAVLISTQTIMNDFITFVPTTYITHLVSFLKCIHSTRMIHKYLAVPKFKIIWFLDLVQRPEITSKQIFGNWVSFRLEI